MLHIFKFIIMIFHLLKYRAERLVKPSELQNDFPFCLPTIQLKMSTAASIQKFAKEMLLILGQIPKIKHSVLLKQKNDDVFLIKYFPFPSSMELLPQPKPNISPFISFVNRAPATSFEKNWMNSVYIIQPPYHEFIYKIQRQRNAEI